MLGRVSTLVAAGASRGKADATLAAAVDAARAALLDDVDAADVGEHLGVVAEGDRVVTHLFACTRPGYEGWRWSVTVARAPRQKQVTVDEVVLVPGEDAIVAPVWVMLVAVTTVMTGPVTSPGGGVGVGVGAGVGVGVGAGVGVGSGAGADSNAAMRPSSEKA